MEKHEKKKTLSASFRQFNRISRTIESCLADMEIIRNKFHEIEATLCGFQHLYYRTLIGLKRIQNEEERESTAEESLVRLDPIMERLAGTCQSLSQVLNSIDFCLDEAATQVNSEKIEELKKNKTISDIQQLILQEDRYRPEQEYTGIMTSRILTEMFEDEQEEYAEVIRENKKRMQQANFEPSGPGNDHDKDMNAANQNPPEPGDFTKNKPLDLKVDEPQR
jgi:hypothetical protein